MPSGGYATDDDPNSSGSSTSGRGRGMSRMEVAMSRVAQEHANYVAEHRRQQQRSPPSSLHQPQQAWLEPETESKVELGSSFENDCNRPVMDLPKSETGNDGAQTSSVSTPTTGHAVPVVEGRVHLQTASSFSGGKHATAVQHTPPPAENVRDCDRDERGLPDAYLTIYSKLQAAKAMAPSPQRKQLLQALYNMGSALLKAQAIPEPGPAPQPAQPRVPQPEGHEPYVQLETAHEHELPAYAHSDLVPCTNDRPAAPAIQAPSDDHIGLNPQVGSRTMSDQMPSVTAAMTLLGEDH